MLTDVELGSTLWTAVRQEIIARSSGRISGLNGVRVEDDGYGLFLWFDEIEYDDQTFPMTEVLDDTDLVWESFFSVVPSNSEGICELLEVALESGDAFFRR